MEYLELFFMIFVYYPEIPRPYYYTTFKFNTSHPLNINYSYTTTTTTTKTTMATTMFNILSITVSYIPTVICNHML